jgi:hypothetical protein
VQISYYSQGPQIVRELLNKKGIHFVVLQHLPEIYLGGACIYAPDGRPVIGLTVRYGHRRKTLSGLSQSLALLIREREENALFSTYLRT